MSDRAPTACAGLRYVTDKAPGIVRIRRGTGFSYRDPGGETIRDQDELERIRAIAVPPAWSDVWICPFANGHLQATGRDDRGRKQYRYHTRWRQVRDATKYEHTVRFATALTAIRERVDLDLARPGLPRQKVLAAVVRLLDRTLIRVGNAEYARDNESYGLTTLRRKHVDVAGSEVRFHFPGKSGKAWDLTVADRRVAKVVRACSDLPGYELFKYEAEDGSLVDVTSGDVNDYLRDIGGEEFTAKDFRTWAGTVLVAVSLDARGAAGSVTEARANVARVMEEVAVELGNTPAICRRCYVHPSIIDAYTEGDLAGKLRVGIAPGRREDALLSPDEISVRNFLRRRPGAAG